MGSRGITANVVAPGVIAGRMTADLFPPDAIRQMVPAGRAAVSILPPGNVKVRFFVPQAVLPKIALGDLVAVQCDNCERDIKVRIGFIAGSAEYTPPVIYSLEERQKLVYLVEARPDAPTDLRVGQPVSVKLLPRETK